jgi:hypothetical protein
MMKIISISSRREMLMSIRTNYETAHRVEKTKILDGSVAATYYDRKYAIQLLLGKAEEGQANKPKKRPGAQIYDESLFMH